MYIGVFIKNIREAQAFVLVYSITDEHSFLEVKNLWEQIKKVRPNILDVPCVIEATRPAPRNATFGFSHIFFCWFYLLSAVNKLSV
jgi:hypothetical protein